MRSPSSLASAGTASRGVARRLAGHLVVGDAGRLDRPPHRGRHHGIEQAHPLLGRQLGGHGLAGGARPGGRPARPGTLVPGSGGRMEASTAWSTLPSFKAFVMRASHSSRRAVVRWSSDSWSALAMPRALVVEVDGPRCGDHGPQLPQPVVLARRLRHRGAVLPVRQPDRGEELVGHGQEGVCRHGGLAGRLGRVVLRLDGLAHGLEAAAEQLFGHGDLLGPQRCQHGVAVHGRRGHDRTLAPGRAPVAVSRPAAAGPAGPAAPAGALAPRSSGDPPSRSEAALRRPPPERPLRSPPSSRRRLADPGARMTETSGARFGVPRTSIRPSVFSGERAGFVGGQRQDLDAFEPDVDIRPQHRTDGFAGRHQGRVDGALGLARAGGAPRPRARRPSGSSTRCRSGVTCGGHATSLRPPARCRAPIGIP